MEDHMVVWLHDVNTQMFPIHSVSLLSLLLSYVA